MASQSNPQTQEFILRWMNGLSIDLDHPHNNPTPSDSEESNALSFLSQVPSIRASSIVVEEETGSDPRIPVHMGLPSSSIRQFHNSFNNRLQTLHSSGIRSADAANILDPFLELGFILSSNGRHMISANEAIDHFDMPFYPKTSIEGVVHFISYSSPLIQEDSTLDQVYKVAKAEISKIQFSTSYKTINATKLQLLGQNQKGQPEKAWHIAIRCSGIRHCEFAHQDVLRTCSAYDDVDIERIYDLEHHASQQHLQLSINDQIKGHTEAVYNGFIENWKQGPQTCQFSRQEFTCSSEIRPQVFARNGVTFIGCSLNCIQEPWHFCKPLPKLSNRVDIEYLQALIRQGYQGKKDTCIYIGHSTDTRKKCGYDHPQGQGCTKYYNQCKALWDLYIPFNMARFPFTCLVARGSHSHYPPRPSRLPISIANDFVTSLQQGDIMNTTPRRFRLTPQYHWLLQKYNASSLSAIHLGLACEDRQWALIRMLRLQQYPLGTHILGVQRELCLDRNKPNEEQWFREIWYSDCGSHFIIVCCTKQQAIQFQYCDHLQMDMSFKMIAGKTMVFSLVGWCPRAKRIIPYCYAFTNLNTRPGYLQLFTMIFRQIANAGQILVHFSYLHHTERGVKTIGVDMCKKQAGGLGDYLHSLDKSRTWDEHIQHLLVFCIVHLKRNFAKRFPKHPARYVILDKLFNASSQEELRQHMQSMCAMYPELKAWIVNKQPQWLLSGLCQSESKVTTSYWIYAKKHTGDSEGSHFQENNFTGRGRSLIAAALFLKIHVQDIFEKLDLKVNKGVGSTWNNQSEQYRQTILDRNRERTYRKSATRRTLDPTIPFNPENPYQQPSTSDQHMLSMIQPSYNQTNSYQSPYSAVSLPAPHMSSISAESESTTSDTIVCLPNVTHARHMLPPPSNQEQGLSRSRKRHFYQPDNSDLDKLEGDIKALKERVMLAKKRQRLLKEQEDLRRELAQLE